MENKRFEKGDGDWGTWILGGTLYENFTDVWDVLEKGDGDTAKVVSGYDAEGKPYTFVFIKDY